jgi:hypothetical protein
MRSRTWCRASTRLRAHSSSEKTRDTCVCTGRLQRRWHRKSSACLDRLCKSHIRHSAPTAAERACALSITPLSNMLFEPKHAPLVAQPLLSRDYQLSLQRSRKTRENHLERRFCCRKDVSTRQRAHRHTPHLWGLLHSIIDCSSSSCSCNAPVFCARVRPSARDFSNGTGGGYGLHGLTTQVTFSSNFKHKGDQTQERRMAVTMMLRRGRREAPARGLHCCRILASGPPSVPPSLRASGDRNDQWEQRRVISERKEMESGGNGMWNAHKFGLLSLFLRLEDL